MKTKISIIGSGPSALLLAAFLDEEKFDVHIYEKNGAAGRKFLVAGDGGFNLTHSEDIHTLITRYSPEAFLKEALLTFSNEDLRTWLRSIGIETFEGSSKRIFPVEGIKPIDVLNAILEVLKKKHVRFHFSHDWKGWKDHSLLFAAGDKEVRVESDIQVFALGGASWKVTGSDGSWRVYFAEKGITLVPFEASNCAMKTAWENEFISQHEGKALKNISVKCGDKEKRGELVVTKYGLEGGALYFHSPEIRKQLRENGKALIHIDLRPDQISDLLLKEFTSNKKLNRGELLAQIGLSKTAVALLKNKLNRDQFLNDRILVDKVKNLEIEILSLAPMDDAISTVGGIALEEVSACFELKKWKRVYCLGEMLDWDAPTGGYLLQGCFSMGVHLARKLNFEDTDQSAGSVSEISSAS